MGEVKVWDDWSGGAFLGGGSFRAEDRYNSLNLQRYDNGSLGPRPGWRKLVNTKTSSLVAADPVTVSAADVGRIQSGFMWGPTDLFLAGEGPIQGYLVHPGMAAGEGRRIGIKPGQANIYTSNAEVLGSTNYVPPDVYRLNYYGPNMLPIGRSSFGSCSYSVSLNILYQVTARNPTGVGYALRPRQQVFYRGRVYGWNAWHQFGQAPGVILVSAAGNNTDIQNFNDDSKGAGEFALGGWSDPLGMWPIGSGLLIYSPWIVFDDTSDAGFWWVMTGTSPDSGQLTPLGFDLGPLTYAQSVIHDGRVLFAVNGSGWAVHDGSSVDKVSLTGLRPGRGGRVPKFEWLNPIRPIRESSLILPFIISEVDPTADDDGIGQWWSSGYGGFEFANLAWTEHQYLGGKGLIGSGHTEFEHDKLASCLMGTSDGGATYYPQYYVRDVTLNRPAVLVDKDIHNPWSDSEEDPPEGAGGSKAIPVMFLETSELRAPGETFLDVTSVTVEYDYWNSDLFHDTCGFEVSLILRDEMGRREVPVTATRVSPPGTSEGVVPNRARVVLNLHGTQVAGTVQVKIHGIVGVAIHSIALNYDALPRFR